MPSADAAFFAEILAMARGGQIAQVMARTEQRREWLRERVPAAERGEPYGRRVLHKDPHGEIMLAGWQTPERCAPHDHGDARGLVFVLRGRFTETRYQHAAGALRVTGHSRVDTGSAIAVTGGLIHDMRCDLHGATLHIYFPAVERMRVYDAAARATWLVDEASGAWIPSDMQRVLGVESWTDVAS